MQEHDGSLGQGLPLQDVPSDRYQFQEAAPEGRQLPGRLIGNVEKGFEQQRMRLPSYSGGFMEENLRQDRIPASELKDKDGEVMQVQAENAPIYTDDLTSQLPDSALAKVTRARGPEYFDGENVWELRPLLEGRRRT